MIRAVARLLALLLVELSLVVAAGFVYFAYWIAAKRAAA